VYNDVKVDHLQKVVDGDSTASGRVAY